MILKPSIRTPTFIFTQSEAATTWTIQHNLGKYPNVQTVDSTNTVVMGGVIQYTDANNLVITFGVAFSGQAFLN